MSFKIRSLYKVAPSLLGHRTWRGEMYYSMVDTMQILTVLLSSPNWIGVAVVLGNIFQRVDAWAKA